MCGMIHYNHGMVIIGPFYKFVQSMYQWNKFKNVFLLSLYFQTIQFLMNMV